MGEDAVGEGVRGGGGAGGKTLVTELEVFLWGGGKHSLYERCLPPSGKRHKP